MNKKLKGILLLAGCLWFGLAATAQDRKDKEQIKALKIAFFTEQLGLNADEAAVFWPLYNEHEKQLRSLRDAQRQVIGRQFDDLDAVSEADARRALEQYLELEEQEEELDKAFYEKISAEFSAVRTLKLFRAEEDFRRRLLREYRKRSGPR
jgi:hypothetical protein